MGRLIANRNLHTLMEIITWSPNIMSNQKEGHFPPMSSSASEYPCPDKWKPSREQRRRKMRRNDFTTPVVNGSPYFIPTKVNVRWNILRVG